uniref:Long-chain-fatty-acid--CoA ligase n=1 Tax=uncultured bacterium A1Q1_fos_91 TaxID=1256591 RepID=L7VVF6_9BACT|nr:long-chain-fatty-acid--CoA ligase [uncultured bacterium A1Q1_fos_91]
MPADATPTPDLAAIEAHLTGPGQPFELEQATILGQPVTAFKHRPRSLRDVLQRSSTFGQADYMVWEDGRRYTYAEHLTLVANLAANLQSIHGIKPGDRVAILAANCPEWVLSFWAVTSLGAVAVGLNAWWTADEILYGIADCQPSLLIADEKRLARLSAEQLASVPCWVLPIDADFEAALREPRAGHTPAALPTTPITEDMPAVMLYTSGTTGRPKAAVHTHGNLGSLLMVSFFHGARLMALRPPAADAPPNCVLVTSPLFHVSGLHCAAVTALGGGAKTVWTMGRFEPLTVLRLIQEERVTGWGYTSTMLHRVVHHPRAAEYDLSSLRMMGGGGSPIPERLQNEALQLVPQVQQTMGVGYGLTEGCAFSTLNPGPELRAHPMSAGRPVPTVELQIRDENGQPLPEGEDGDIHVRGPLVMLEYFGNPEATASVLLPGRWLRTGDVGQLRDGRLYLCSRKRDLILRGGENVYPQEIEQRLEAHPLVAECAVVGVPDEELGQRVAAFVRVTEQAPPPSPQLEDALRAWVAEALAYFKVPAELRFVTEPLPRNATGKVLKHVLLGEQSAFIEE